MFAGPNGSGKSTLKSYLPPALLGIYLNPDEIEQQIRTHGHLDFAAFGIQPSESAAHAFLASSAFLRDEGLTAEAAKIGFSAGRVDFTKVAVNSYFASALVDFLRQQLLAARISFTFETVMSHPGKVELLTQAQAAGYRTYLYFVATEDPAINISRVRNRVKLKGHSVPEDKIAPRYYRSLDLLMTAIRHSNRAYIFDNSSDSANGAQTWLAEITEGRILELKTDKIPTWFARAVLDKIR